MNVSFKYNSEEGFITDTPGKTRIVLKNSLSNHQENYAPTELLLLSMGGCTSDDVLSMLKKMRVNFTEFRCEVNAERHEEHPRTVKNADIHYIFSGDVDAEKARKAIGLSLNKYCSVSILAKRGGANVTYSLTINGETLDSRSNPGLLAEV
ncbi:MAG: OsmC family protein [Candidatus Thermoplasmatota archaeon]|nr:OsmC family protein [Candidatus Thermoplasmatota archaeon]